MAKKNSPKVVPARKAAAKKPVAAARPALPGTRPPPDNLAAEKPLPTFEPVLLIVGASDAKVFGRTLTERLHIQFKRAGLDKVVAEDTARSHAGPIVFVRADAVLDQPLIAGLIKRPNMLLLSDDGGNATVLAGNIRARDLDAVLQALGEGKIPAVRGLLCRSPEQLELDFWQALRKKETPYALAVTDTNLNDVTWRMFMGTYKGATDLVTKHVWPRPAYHVTQFLAGRSVTPNMVTTVAALTTIAAFFLFLRGQYGWGLLAAWLMTFLDTVDGKLARTTLTSSTWGDVFDHGIDLVHPPFWYVAWALGLAAWGQQFSPAGFWWSTGIILGGYVLQRVIEGISIKWLGLEIHIWRPIDTLFRQVTARRNPNLILLTLAWAVGRPDVGLIAVAAWTGICLVLHGFQLLQALRARQAAGTPLRSWMART